MPPENRSDWMGLGMPRKIRLAVICAVCCLTLITTGAVSRAAGSTEGKPIELRVGQAAFWNGAYVLDQHTQLPGTASCAVSTCYDYPVQVAAGGWRLRVALDTPDRSNQFELDLIDPSGTVRAAANNPLQSQFDMEVFATHPSAGRWTARVVPQNVHSASFRMRGKLEAGPVTYPQKTLLLPDLMVTPPYEFTFTAPANPLNAYAPDTANPPLAAAGIAPLSCTPDEMVGDHVTRCLRFTTGPRDAGPGPFEIDYNPSGAMFGLLAPGPAYQRVYYSDGSSFLRRAGEFQFHPEHGHYHYLNFLDFQLFHVTGSSHLLTPAGSGKKLGLCPADELFADWHTFNQQQTNTFTANCGYSPGEASMGLNIGWGDVYRWQRPGQYVDFSGDGDGYYLLQVTVNAGHQVLVVHPHDNVGYAYIHVVGDRVTLIERGQGTSPWDPAKVVFTDQ
jgi:lysyl oxidase